jgi:hypothetical protein
MAAMSAMRARCVFLVLAAVACGKGNDDGKASGSAAASGSSVTKTVEGSATAPAAGSATPAVAPAGSATPQAPASATRDPEAAKAANTRGMQLHTAKKYKEAMAEFEKAIAADDSFVLAHYNLACAASRAEDKDVASKEMSWIASAAAWDDVAANAAKKAPTDPDLGWFMHARPGFQDLSSLREDLLVHHSALPGDDGTGDPTPASVAKLLATASGKHDSSCDRSDANQKRVLSIPADASGQVTLAASLADGAALVMDDKVVSRTDPFGCTAPGASQDHLDLVHMSEGADYGPPGIAGETLVVVAYSNGGRRSWTNNVAVVLVNGMHLARVFDATVASSDDTTPGTLVLTPIGDIVLGQPGVKQKRVFRWNAGTSKFEEVKVN